MPRKIVTWECETCGKDYGYCGYEEARNCEIGHITDKAVAKTREAIARIQTELERDRPSLSPRVRDILARKAANAEMVRRFGMD